MRERNSESYLKSELRTSQVFARHGGQALRTAVSDSGYNKSLPI
jgi:hypothetical protein